MLILVSPLSSTPSLDSWAYPSLNFYHAGRGGAFSLVAL